MVLKLEKERPSAWGCVHWRPPGFLATIVVESGEYPEPWSYCIDRDEYDDGRPLGESLCSGGAWTFKQALEAVFDWWIEAQGGFDDS